MGCGPDLQHLLSTIGGALGTCGIINGKGVNLGYVQSNPQAAVDGSITISYGNGDKCGESRYSTRIIFQCDDSPVSTPSESFSCGHAKVCQGERDSG